MAHRGCVQGCTENDRVYSGSIQGHREDVHGDDSENTGGDRGFSYGQAILEPVV